MEPGFVCHVVSLALTVSTFFMEPNWLQGKKPMAGLYPRGSKKWIEALDHAPEDRWWVKKQRLEMLEADEQKKVEKN